MAMTLEIRNLSVNFHGAGLGLQVVRGVCLRLPPGQRASLVGESGCGKTVLAMALLGLLPQNARISGEAFFGDWNLLDPPATARLRGKEIAICWSNAERYFNPVLPVGPQIAEAYLQHHPGRRREARQRTLELLQGMGFADPLRVWKARPFQLSGGMNQRAMIAMSVINEPRLLFVDEPTRGLDDDNWERVVDCLLRLNGMSLFIITHDLRLVRRAGGWLYFMRGGRLVAGGSCPDLLNHPPPGYVSDLVRSASGWFRDTTAEVCRGRT